MKSIAELYLHYFVFGQTLIDKIAIKGGLSEHYKYEFDNYDRVIDLLNGNSGVVIIGAHIGCWESGVGFFGKYGKRINIVMLDAEHGDIKEVLEENAAQTDNYNVIDINQDPIDAMLSMKIALNKGEYVCFNGDRYVDKRHTYNVNLLGAQALLPVGPFMIATKCRVPVIFYYGMREANCTYRFIFEIPAIGKDISANDLAREYAGSVERIVRKYPRQWFNFYDYWNIN